MSKFFTALDAVDAAVAEPAFGQEDVPTGLHDLDKTIGGWPRGELSVIAGRPCMGKTAFAISSLMAAASGGYGCLFLSLATPKRQIGARLLAAAAYNDKEASVTYRDILRHHHRCGALGSNRYANARKRLENMTMQIHDQCDISIEDIYTRTREVCSDLENSLLGKLDLIVVDHVGLIKPSARYAGSRVNELAEISGGLSRLARATNAAVVAVSQLNRGAESREDRRPILSDLRDSGVIEEDASVVVLLYRPAYYIEQFKPEDDDVAKYRDACLERRGNTLEFIVAKNRNGAPAVIDAFVDISANVIRDREWRR